MKILHSISWPPIGLVFSGWRQSNANPAWIGVYPLLPFPIVDSGDYGRKYFVSMTVNGNAYGVACALPGQAESLHGAVNQQTVSGDQIGSGSSVTIQ